MKLHLEITGKCNLNCVYCYNSSFNKKNKIKTQLKVKDWIKIIEEANSLGCKRYSISGGEPLLVPEIFLILKKCKAPIILFTNATFLNENIIKKLRAIKNLKAIRISLDGCQSHDTYRIPSKSSDIIKKIKLIKKITKISIGVTTQFNKYLIDELPKFYEILKDLKIDHWRIDLPFYLGRYKEKALRFKQASFKEMILAYRQLLKQYFKDGKPFKLNISNIYNSAISTEDYSDFSLDQHPCCEQDIISFKPNGDMVVCPAYNLFLANVKKSKNLKATITKGRSNNFYKIRIKDIKKCSQCRYIKICGGGCRADAFNLTGDNLMSDPIVCSLMPLIERYIIPVMPTKESNKIIKLIVKNGNKPKIFSSIKAIMSHYKTF